MSDNPYAAPFAPLTCVSELPRQSILGLASMKIGIYVMVVFLLFGGANITSREPAWCIHFLLIITWMPLTIFNGVGFIYGCASLLQRGCVRVHAVIGLLLNATPLTFVIYCWQVTP